MNVHFGSKDFHLSCFGELLMKKKQQDNIFAFTAFTSFSLFTLAAFKKNNMCFFNSFCGIFYHSLHCASWGHEMRASIRIFRSLSDWIRRATICTRLQLHIWHFADIVALEILFWWNWIQMNGNLLVIYPMEILQLIDIHLQLRRLQLHCHPLTFSITLECLRRFRFLQRCVLRILQRWCRRQLIFRIQVAE